MQFKSLIMLTILSLLFSSCATSKTRYREGDNKGQASDLTVTDEINLTKDALKSMAKDYPPTKDRALQRYVSSLGQRLVKVNGLNGKPYKYTFTVVDTPMVNAFALPAGTIYVTKPLLKAVKTEAELAGVLGHEMGHVIARHTAERMTLMNKERTGNLLMTAGAAIIGAAGGYMAAKKLCKKGDKECLLKGTAAGGALFGGATLLVQKYRYMQNSQEDEFEADRLGFKIATKAGYNPHQIGKFYETLLALENKGKKGQNKYLAQFQDAMSTHPPSQKRIDQMRDMASPLPNKGLLSSNAFHTMKKRL